MDYMRFVDYHRSNNSDITIGCIAYDENRASDFGLMKVGKWTAAEVLSHDYTATFTPFTRPSSAQGL